MGTVTASDSPVTSIVMDRDQGTVGTAKRDVLRGAVGTLSDRTMPRQAIETDVPPDAPSVTVCHIRKDGGMPGIED